MGIRNKEDILTTLQNIARSIGKQTLSKKDVQPHIPVSSIRYHFGSLGNALEQAGLQRGDPTAHLRDRQPVITDAELFRSMLEVEQQIGHEPRGNEYDAFGRYSSRPFRKRFGKWRDVLVYYRKWRAEDESVAVVNDATESASSAGYSDAMKQEASPPHFEPTKKRPGGPAQLYGEPIDFRGLRHAPTNEQGVVYLFGMVSRELGFNVESVQQGFPDCEAKYLFDRRQGLWAKARIEFEFRSSHFSLHGHDPAQCDFVVCWVHDWENCPLEVIELRSALMRLPNR